MKKGVIRNIRLGIFVILGSVIFVAALFYIGNRQRIFGSYIDIHSVFSNVSGLQSGNNVTLSGINIGTVKSVEILSDTSVLVTFSVDKNASRYIKKDSRASIGTEGLMGYKLVRISSGSFHAPGVREGDYIPSTAPVELDEVVLTLKETGDNAQTITQNLAELSKMIKEGEGFIGKLVGDKSFADRLDKTMETFQRSGDQISSTITMMTEKTKKGEGVLGKLIVDDELSNDITAIIDSLKVAGDNSTEITENLRHLTDKLSNGDGPLNKLLTDTIMARNIDQSVENAERGTKEFELLMRKLRCGRLTNFLFGRDN